MVHYWQLHEQDYPYYGYYDFRTTAITTTMMATIPIHKLHQQKQRVLSRPILPCSRSWRNSVSITVKSMACWDRECGKRLAASRPLKSYPSLARSTVRHWKRCRSSKRTSRVRLAWGVVQSPRSDQSCWPRLRDLLSYLTIIQKRSLLHVRCLIRRRRSGSAPHRKRL